MTKNGAIARLVEAKPVVAITFGTVGREEFMNMLQEHGRLARSELVHGKNPKAIVQIATENPDSLRVIVVAANCREKSVRALTEGLEAAKIKVPVIGLGKGAAEQGDKLDYGCSQAMTANELLTWFVGLRFQ